MSETVAAGGFGEVGVGKIREEWKEEAFSVQGWQAKRYLCEIT